MSYDHTQKAPMYLVLVATAVAVAVAGAAVLRVHVALAVVLWISAALVAALSLCMRHLTVRDAGDHLIVSFGPVALFRRHIAYADIESAAAGRSRWIDGWGIHYGPGLGWVWNLWGFGCVTLTLKGRGRYFRVGTDDPQGLATFVNARIATPPAQAPGLA